MDSYQRGYAPGINGVIGASIGSANIINIQSFGIDDAKYSAWQDVSFYASTYDWNGTTVISYRGTDFDILSDGEGVFDTELIKDLQYGWTSFLKVPPVPGTLLAYASLAYALPAQFPLARAFFRAVTGSDFSDGALAGANDNIAARCAAA